MITKEMENKIFEKATTKNSAKSFLRKVRNTFRADDIMDLPKMGLVQTKDGFYTWSEMNNTFYLLMPNPVA